MRPADFEEFSPHDPGEAFMAMELAPGAMEGVTGRVQYPPPFERLGE
jgi:predicted N-acetyltransferase YhbS